MFSATCDWFCTDGSHIRKTWKLINYILSKTKKQPSQKRFKEGENIINDKAEIVEFFLQILGQILQIR